MIIQTKPLCDLKRGLRARIAAEADAINPARCFRKWAANYSELTSCGTGVEHRSVKLMVKFLLANCLALYFVSFLAVHRSSTLRRPAYNMAYWYYSDRVTVEFVEFYAYWPLRQITYMLFPHFMSEHISERKWAEPSYPQGFEG